MMSFKENPITRIRTVYANRHEPEYAHAFADLSWRMLLLAGCIVILGSCAYGASQFGSALADLSSIAPPPVSPVPSGSQIDQKKLDATLSGFTARSADFEALQASAIQPIADPSQ